MEDNLQKMFDFLMQESERLMKINVNHKGFQQEVDRAKGLALLSSQFISGMQIQLRKELIKENSTRKLGYGEVIEG